MDRPEDVEVSPTTGKVYMACTNNSSRGVGANPGVDGVNPRAANRAGHIIEITETGGDQTATTFAWNILLLCGEPAAADTYFAGFDKAQVSRIGAPDNLAFDSQGYLFIATDGMPSALAAGATPGPNDAVYAVPLDGPHRGHLKALVGSVAGCETAAIFVNPDDRTLWVSIQHPGEGGSIATPTSQWPSAPTDGVARPSVIAVRRVAGTPVAYGTDAPDPVVPEFSSPLLAVTAAGGLLAGAVAFRNRRTRPAS
jgi:secreted PhoX family phosphatase